jgi:hypothetical protein
MHVNARTLIPLHEAMLVPQYIPVRSDNHHQNCRSRFFWIFILNWSRLALALLLSLTFPPLNRHTVQHRMYRLDLYREPLLVFLEGFSRRLCFILFQMDAATIVFTTWLFAVKADGSFIWRRIETFELRKYFLTIHSDNMVAAQQY